MSFYGLVGQGPLVYATASESAVYILGDQGLHRRAPASGTWSIVATPGQMIAGGPYNLCTLHGAANVVTVTTGDAIAQTRDSGATWDVIPNPAGIEVGDEAFVFIQHGTNADTLYLAQGFASDGSGSTIWKTTDAGVTWTRIIGPYADTSADLGLGIIWHAVTESRLWYTARRDPTGAFLVNELFHYSNLDGSTQVHLAVQRPADVNGGYVTAVRGDDLQAYIWEITSGGVTPPSVIYRVDGSTLTDVTPAGFVPTNTVLYAPIVGNTEGVVLAAVRDNTAPFSTRVLRSTNFGASWATVLGGGEQLSVRIGTQSFAHNGPMIVNNPVNLDEWWVARNVDALVNYSNDGGATWTTESVPSLENTQIYSMAAEG